MRCLNCRSHCDIPAGYWFYTSRRHYRVRHPTRLCSKCDTAGYGKPLPASLSFQVHQLMLHLMPVADCEQASELHSTEHYAVGPMMCFLSSFAFSPKRAIHLVLPLAQMRVLRGKLRCMCRL